MTTTQCTPTSTVNALLAAIDSRDLATIDEVIADDVHFRFGNGEPTDTKAEFAVAAQAFLGAIAEIRDEVVEVWGACGWQGRPHDGRALPAPRRARADPALPQRLRRPRRARP